MTEIKQKAAEERFLKAARRGLEDGLGMVEMVGLLRKAQPLGTCDGCGEDLYLMTVHDCPVGGNEVTIEEAS